MTQVFRKVVETCQALHGATSVKTRAVRRTLASINVKLGRYTDAAR
jgi:hypothetical protein